MPKLLSLTFWLRLWQGDVEVQQLDLADLSNVRSFANNLQSEPKIDMLILNAGVAGLPLTYTKDNFEMQVGTNHFGHFVLVQSLLDKLKEQVKTAWIVPYPQDLFCMAVSYLLQAPPYSGMHTRMMQHTCFRGIPTSLQQLTELSLIHSLEWSAGWSNTWIPLRTLQ